MNIQKIFIIISIIIFSTFNTYAEGLTGSVDKLSDR